MDDDDKRFIESLMKVSESQSLKKQRLTRNLLGILLLLVWPAIGLFAFVKITKSHGFVWSELLRNELFLCGTMVSMLVFTPVILLIFHLSENGNYDDLKKNDLIVTLYKKLKNND